MFRRVGGLLSFAALFALSGGHWTTLQLIAWSGMAVTYTQAFGLRDGLNRTFSGNNPCGLCLKIEESRAKEDSQKPLRLAQPLKLEAIASRSILLPSRAPSAISTWPFDPLLPVPDLRQEPETPPPRHA
ncbi:MAG: hypothetical protein SNJ84_02330 [Verrucomicrobiia bacterium]